MTVDIIFPRKRRVDLATDNLEQIYKVTNYSDNENMWEFLCQIGQYAKKPNENLEVPFI